MITTGRKTNEASPMIVLTIIPRKSFEPTVQEGGIQTAQLRRELTIWEATVAKIYGAE